MYSWTWVYDTGMLGIDICPWYHYSTMILLTIEPDWFVDPVVKVLLRPKQEGVQVPLYGLLLVHLQVLPILLLYELLQVHLQVKVARQVAVQVPIFNDPTPSSRKMKRMPNAISRDSSNVRRDGASSKYVCRKRFPARNTSLRKPQGLLYTLLCLYKSRLKLAIYSTDLLSTNITLFVLS